MVRRFSWIVLIAAGMALNVCAQDGFTAIFDLNGTNGGNPTAPLVQGLDGDLYGTATGGGINCPPYGCGTFFKISPAGKMTVLYNFCPEGLPCATSGAYPAGGLALGADGKVYGVTTYGGAGGVGTLFAIAPTGALTTLYNWCSQPNCADGSELFAYPLGSPVQDSSGNWYGTTYYGGGACAPMGPGGCGTIFKLTPRGELTTLHDFCQETGCPDGFSPSGLIQAPDGNFYGTTQSGGGAYANGTVFRISPWGEFTTLHVFCPEGGPACTDGALPIGPLVQAVDGRLYGTTSYGGSGAACGSGPDCGTVFYVTSEGAFTTIYNFCSLPNCEDGGFAAGQLVQGSDGDLYGQTFYGGANGDGALFRITPGGVLTTLHSFDVPYAGYPLGGVVQATGGDLYGTTFYGGIAISDLCYDTCGTVYRASDDLPAFVETVPTVGAPLSRVDILGNDLETATRVSFNGMPTLFRVMSNTWISAWVPNGAATGFVTVTTRSRTLRSNTKFQVLGYSQQ